MTLLAMLVWSYSLTLANRLSLMARLEQDEPKTVDFLVGSRFFHASVVDAVSALEAVGATYEPRLDLVVEHELGVVQRRFGVVKNVLTHPDAEDARLLRPLARALEHFVNYEVRKEMRARALPYTPVNKGMIQQLVLAIHQARVHLPWSFWPMNYDLAGLMSEVWESEASLPFEVFYSQTVELYPGAKHAFGLAKVGRLFSLPISMSAHGTWHEMHAELDIDVALVLEANSLGVVSPRVSQTTAVPQRPKAPAAQPLLPDDFSVGFDDV